MTERYPEPITNFTVWYNGKMRQIETACDEYQISDAVEAIRPYAQAKWCFQSWLDDAELLAKKARDRIKKTKAGLL